MNKKLKEAQEHKIDIYATDANQIQSAILEKIDLILDLIKRDIEIGVPK